MRRDVLAFPYEKLSVNAATSCIAYTAHTQHRGAPIFLKGCKNVFMLRGLLFHGIVHLRSDFPRIFISNGIALDLMSLILEQGRLAQSRSEFTNVQGY